MQFRTCDSVLEWLNDSVRSKTPISAHQWVEAAQYLNILRSEEQEKLYTLKSIIAKRMADEISNSKTAAAAKIICNAMDEKLMADIIDGKLTRIEETIRLAKKQAQLADNEWRNQK